MNITQGKELIVFILIVILAFFIGYNGLYRQYLNRINSIKAKINEEEKKNDMLRIIDGLDKKMQEYQNRSLTTTDVTQLLDRILELAKQVNVAIESFNPLPEKYREEYIEFPLQIPIRCEYHRLGQFLDLIENSQGFLWVKELKMRKSTVTDLEEVRIHQIDLTISGLYLRK